MLHRLSDWELWACARQQIARHGDSALQAAAMRADQLLAAGDVEGNAVWTDIVARIRQLTAPDPGATCH
jgi:hypothetical protein